MSDPTALPTLMKAAIRTSWTSFQIDHVADHPTPVPPSNPEWMLVKVHAAALNPVDYKLPKLLSGTVLGIDFCGTVMAVHRDCTNPQVGDVVMGLAKGTLAEYALCKASTVTKVPAGWTEEEAAAFPIACGVAMEGFEQAGVIQAHREDSQRPPISSLLVIGASGGCGMVALQLAKGMGIPEIVGICSTQNANLCKANGATKIVPYDDANALATFLKEKKGQVDMIYDAASYSGAGEDYCNRPAILALLPADSRPSRYILLNGSIATWIRALTVGTKSCRKNLIGLPKISAESLRLGAELLNKANLKPLLDSSHEFTKEGVLEAYKHLKSRRARGKIVVSISKPQR